MKNGGFSALEAVIALLLMTAVGFGIASSIAKGLQSVVNVQKTNKARLLADMVFEQYNSHVGSANLASFDTPATGQTPAAFFATGTDNLGFDEFIIKSQSACTTASINCLVTVDILWQDGGKPVTKRFTRNFSTSTASKTGATVDVWVKQNCAVLPATVISSCPGVGGFEVTAPPADSNYLSYRAVPEIIGYSLSDGHAILRNVAVGTVNIKARKPGSAANCTGANCSQGYYVNTNPGVASFMVKTLSTNLAAPNIALFTEFLPLGKITGQLSYPDSSPAPGLLINPNSNISQQFASSGFGLAPAPSIISDAQGVYTVFNVVPGPWTLQVLGDPGSHPRIVPADTDDYRAGSNGGAAVVGANVPIPPDLLSPTAARSDITVYHNGWLDLTLLKSDLTPETGPGTVYVRTFLGMTGFTSAFSNYPGSIVAPAVAGHLALYNMYAQDVNTRVYVWKAPFGTDPGSYARTDVFRALNNQGNFLTVVTDPNYTITGSLMDGVGSPIASARLSMMVVAGSTITAVTGASGNFSLVGFSPFAQGVPIQAFDESSPFVLRGVLLTVTLPSLQVGATLSGTTNDTATGLPVPGATIQAEDGTGSTVSDASGNFSLTTNVTFKQNVLVQLTCNPATRTCAITAPATFSIDQTRFMTRIMASRPNFVILPLSATFSSASPSVSGLNPLMLMMSFPVSGIVSDSATGSPLKGISVCSEITHPFNKDNPYGSPSCVATDATGRYTLNMRLYSRALTVPPYPYGYGDISIAAEQRDLTTGNIYDGFGDGGAVDANRVALSASDTAGSSPERLDIQLIRLPGAL